MNLRPQVFRTPRRSIRWASELLWKLTVHRLNIRYKETLLGFGWILLQPVGLTMIFNYLQRIAKIPTGSVPYPLFTATGLIAWSLTSLVASQSVLAIYNYSTLLKKVPIPKIIFPLCVILTAIADLCVMLLLLIGLLFYYHYPLSFDSALILIPFFVHMLFLVGLSCLLSLSVIFLRDIAQAVSFLLQLWFLCSPVFYPASMVPSDFRWLAKWNPMMGIIEGYRSAFLLGRLPSPDLFGPTIVVSVSVFCLGLFLMWKFDKILTDLL